MTSDVWILDLEAGQWAGQEPMGTPRFSHFCLEVVIGGERGVLVGGGATEEGSLASTEFFSSKVSLGLILLFYDCS